MSFTNLITKTELVKSFQHFELNVYLSFLMKDIITKKDSTSSLMSFTSQTTKTELIKKL